MHNNKVQMPVVPVPSVVPLEPLPFTRHCEIYNIPKEQQLQLCDVSQRICCPTFTDYFFNWHLLWLSSFRIFRKLRIREGCGAARVSEEKASNFLCNLGAQNLREITVFSKTKAKPR